MPRDFLFTFPVESDKIKANFTPTEMMSRQSTLPNPSERNNQRLKVVPGTGFEKCACEFEG